MSSMCAGKGSCAYDNGGCSRYATCTETHPGRQCTCNEGFTGNGFTCTSELCNRPLNALLGRPIYVEEILSWAPAGFFPGVNKLGGLETSAPSPCRCLRTPMNSIVLLTF